MRIVNYSGSGNLDDIESLTITIKAVPFENSYVPVFLIISPDDDYQISIDELHALMDGVEIAQKKIDDIIAYILRTKVFKEQEEKDDLGESD